MHLSQIDFLRHIQKECIYLIQESSDNSFEDFLHDERLSRAICRSLEIIGEASAKIHPDFKAKYPLLPWHDMGDIQGLSARLFP